MTKHTLPQHNETASSPAARARCTRFGKAPREPVRQTLVQRLAREVNQCTRVALFDVFAVAERYGLSRRHFHLNTRMPHAKRFAGSRPRHASPGSTVPPRPCRQRERPPSGGRVHCGVDVPWPCGDAAGRGGEAVPEASQLRRRSCDICNTLLQIGLWRNRVSLFKRFALVRKPA